MNGYVITDTNKTVWVCKGNNGTYSLTTDKNKALIFDSKPAADAIFKSNLSKLIKSKGVTVKSVMVQIAGADNQVKKVEESTPKSEAKPDSSKYIISVLSEAVSKLNYRHTVLSEELSKFDRQLSDVEHYIEFNIGKLNACDGYKAYKILQDVLVERRKVKDELAIINTVKDRMVFPEDIDEKVQELESRCYTPREFKHLF